MPVVYVHGVATRMDQPGYEDHWAQIRTYLQRYIAPAIAAKPEQVEIVSAYWGDLGARFAWDGDSRPRTPLLGQGAAAAPSVEEQGLALTDLHTALSDLPAAPPTQASAAGLLPAGPATSSALVNASNVRLRDLAAHQLSNLAAVILASVVNDSKQQALAAIAADTVAHDADARRRIAACTSRDEELVLLQSLVEARYIIERQAQGAVLIAQGGDGWAQRLKDGLGEALGRIGSVPGFVASRAVVEARKPINDQVTLFLGDVFAYLNNRGSAQSPGTIPARVLDRLTTAQQARQEPGEPLVVLSHSMGGQIVYDLVTHFIPQLPAYRDLRVDFWCATASQVGLFEEMKLFLNSKPKYSKAHNNEVPFPDRRHLGGWWNVWDHNDFISYSVEGIINGVDDQNYNSGMSLLHAHSGYVGRPSFYRDFADRLEAARQQNWWRP
jgi:hypothetical protein